MTTEELNQMADKLKKAMKEHMMERFASEVIEGNQSWDKIKQNSLNEQPKQSVQNEQNLKTNKKRKSIRNISSKPKMEQKMLNIGSPIIETGYADTKLVPIQPFGAKGSLDSRRASISSNTSTFSSFKPDDFQDNSDIASLKSQRSASIDSGISSLSEALSISSSSESLASITSQDSAFIDEREPSLVDEKAKVARFSTVKKPAVRGKLVKVAPPTVPTLKSSVIDRNSDNILNSAKPAGEGVNSAKKSFSNLEESLKADRSNGEFSSLKELILLQEKVKEINRKDQLSSEIDKFIPQVSVSRRKTVEEKVKYGTFDMLKVSAEKLDLKIKKVDSLLKKGSLMKVDRNNNDNVLLITKKDMPLLKELRGDLKRELHKVKQNLHKEIKKIQIREQQGQQKLQDDILKDNIKKIERVISTAKAKVDLKERYEFLLTQLGKMQTSFNQDRKLHPNLKETMTELRREKWASQTNMWAIKPDDVTKSYLPESRIDLTFAEKKEIFARKRDIAKDLLDSEQVRGEDKEVLKGLYKLYSSLAKSSEKKPKERSNLERAFNQEFGHAYKESCRTRLSEVSLSSITPTLNKQ